MGKVVNKNGKVSFDQLKLVTGRISKELKKLEEKIGTGGVEEGLGVTIDKDHRLNIALSEGNANGLGFDDDGNLQMSVATDEASGAMPKELFTKINELDTVTDQDIDDMLNGYFGVQIGVSPKLYYVGADVGKYETLSTNATVKTADYMGEAYDYIHIEVTGTNLQKYVNGYGQEGYWVGFHVNKPEGATKLFRAYTGYSDATTFDALMAKSLDEYTDLATEGNFQSYPDLSRQTERWVRLQWQNDDGDVVDETIYHLDCRNVTLVTE